MSIVSTHAALVLIGFRSRARDPRVFVAESDAFMHEIANGLYSCPARIGLAEQFPGQVEHAIAVAVTAGEEKDESLLWELVH